MFDILNAAQLALIPSVWIYSGIFIVCLLEGAPVVGSFFPGGTTLLAVGAVAGLGIVDPIWVVVIASLGSILGDLIGYFIMRFYGDKVFLIKKLIDSVRKNEGWLTDVFDKKYFMITILARLIPFMRVASSVAAAARSISMTGYIFATILASTLWAAAGVAMGYGLTELLEIRHIIIALTAFCAGSALLAAIKHVRQKNHAQAVV